MALSLAMFVGAGHFWNIEKVFPATLYAFDFMFVLLAVFIGAIMMQDASEKRKNVTALLLVIASGLSVAFVLC